MIRIAVTGASGFVGQYVLAELGKLPIHTVAATRTPEKFPKGLPYSELVKFDIEEIPNDCYKRLGKPDILIHLAWSGLPNYNSLHHFEEELPKQYIFLKTMIESGMPSLFVAGTCFEYGMQEGCLSETDTGLPHNPYGFAKDTLRRQLEFLQATMKFEMTWGRLFYMYGEGQSTKSLYTQFKTAIYSGDKIFNMSSGEQLRDYLPVEEVARLIVVLAMKKIGLGVVNVCSGEPVSIRSLVKGWVGNFGEEIKLNYGYYPIPDYEPKAFWGDRRKLDEFLGE